MGSVRDYGGPGLPLNEPPLGGGDGWAEAVANALDMSDVSVDERIAAALGASAALVKYAWSSIITGDPGAGSLSVEPTGGLTRTIRLSRFDHEGREVNGNLLLPGDTITVTDDPDTPPISGFARYSVTSDVVEEAWGWTIQALRGDQAGSPSAPPDGTIVRVLVTLSASSGGGGEPGVTDHGELTGLLDDDHTHYALADGSRGNFAATSHSHGYGDLPADVATDSDVADAIAAHVATPDAHPGYATDQELSNLEAYLLPQIGSKWTMWSGTQADYDSIPVKDGATLYAILAE